jgi:hypothetical protein|eukprot:TRINITY_DN16387_c0_g1_i1.p1 TRINITY_DN16387_c0_g1~~TRINITY_DN16387_c0_g1_i1.p1  ORF type:complete len:562 (-),score=162.62 TRINITY_DN16387_c0_g1_i1:223-1836(-)
MAGTLSVDVEKRIKALRKKLTQIDKLKSKDNFTPEEKDKIASEPKILAEISALERGEEFEPERFMVVVPAVVAPEVPEDPKPQDPPPEIREIAEPPEVVLPDISPVEAEKRIRALKKKLAQIHKLKERGGTFSKEENDKIDAEHDLNAEVENLEMNLLEPEAKKTAKAIHKKIDQISKLRKRGGVLTLPEKEKLSKEAGLRKELAEILATRPVHKDPTPAHQADALVAAKTPAAAARVEKKAPPAPPANEQTPEPEDLLLVEEQDLEPWATWPSGTDEVAEDEGFVEAHGRHRKHRRAKEAAAAAATAPPMQEAEPTLTVSAADASYESWDAVVDEVPQWDEPVPSPSQPTLAPPTAVPPPVSKPTPEAPPRGQDAGMEARGEHAEGSTDKRIRALKKKLGQIHKLKARGGTYTDEEQQKLAGESLLNQEIHALETGEPWPPIVEQPVAPEEAVVPEVEQQEEEEEPETVEEPPPLVPVGLSRDDAQKRIKALKKKLSQIARLKERGGDYSPEEAEKIAGEPRLLLEIDALEAHIRG